MPVLDDARLYFVVEASASDRLLSEALAGGVDLLQLRDHDASDDELLDAAERFREACDVHGALFVVNDRPEIALQAGADGVHVGQDDLPVEAVRRLGIEPVHTIIRGGTDGARLSHRGLPTPNLFTGGSEYHSRREWASVQDMAAAAAMIVELAQVWAEKSA